ncbi:MAG TPA: fumarylacetoacetate hydrolase family protein [Steroidobacteraceae bacterium]|jgi:fumarylpyruvate hydrolase|nr:fumarylacetoacetate hydrolase family protein [Steroidobacteraceae bacterium]
MAFAIPEPPRATIPVEGSHELFPVRRIFCVGRNYAEHAREMGGDPNREPPFFFCKPADALVPTGGKLVFPIATKNLHHEVELAVALKGGGLRLSAEAAQALIFGYAVALDMTRRDMQAEAKRLARPWDMAKGFDQSCPISALRPAAPASTSLRGELLLSVNGEIRQRGDLSDMIWSPGECLAVLSTLVELRAGDLLLTGTPAGVGAVVAGDVLEARSALTPALRVHYVGLEAR